MILNIKNINYIFDDIYSEFNNHFINIDDHEKDIILLKSYNKLIVLYIFINSILTMYVLIKYFN